MVGLFRRLWGDFWEGQGHFAERSVVAEATKKKDDRQQEDGVGASWLWEMVDRDEEYTLTGDRFTLCIYRYCHGKNHKENVKFISLFS